MAEITFSGVTKVFAGNVTAVDNLDLHVADGEFMVLVGPSGCGKTTALRMLAGLEEISSGTLSIGGRVVNHVLPKDRDVAMVFQNYALYPHMTVAQNMGFALKIRGESKAEVERKVREAATILHLGDYLDRRPRALSGGQRQRVAMGRAIVRSPQAFLMDEPLSNLDAQLRVEMRVEIARIQRLLGVATVYVTHDQIEAMTMGDRVAVMRGGQLQQVAPPQVLYDHPANEFVAGFMGSPPMNLLRVRTSRSQGRVGLTVGAQRLDVPAAYGATHDLSRDEGAEVVLGVRPEDIEVVGGGVGGPTLTTRVERREALGAEILVHLSVADSGAASSVAYDEDLAVSRPTTLVARMAPQARVEVGDVLTVRLNEERLHFFDADGGVTLRRERP
ncbi:MAG TPA: sn-glycerol-3-phosphate ABC transporter ATP-binding protein UgpC [Acidimicrobiales bacterium]|nr:MAG: ABC transporter ATP-binding protein [Actinobacteria bacterium 21-73-9]HQU25889.1 sn-glycerol-3-phosphate ABC transporter ATP-binding protein UgpC [Acidimicrobiales bacterium]